MREHNDSRIVPYAPEIMFGVVADVEHYPEFLPWVVALRIKSRSAVGEREIVIAEMAVGYRALRERYTSRVALDPKARRIDVAAIEGPFRVLENHWRFTPEGAGTKVDFRVAFEFSNRLLQSVAGGAFEKALLTMSDAFQARAASLSGRAS